MRIWVGLSLIRGRRDDEPAGWEQVVQMVGVPNVGDELDYNDTVYTVDVVRWTPTADGSHDEPGVVLVLR